MATQEQPRNVEPVSAAQHHMPLSGRAHRAHSVHRLQVGLFGLCAMLLIVGLANIIMDRAKLSEVDGPIDEVTAADEPPKKAAVEPLADIGVVPASDPVPVSDPAPQLEQLPAPDPLLDE
ncbi:MAG: hypothetical protein KUG65_03395 [Sphingomonadaceae bacterium]|nr:hypothetical protein [Sphingomonadaceae bacterium]